MTPALKQHFEPTKLGSRGASVSDAVPVVVEKPPFLPPSILCKVFWILFRRFQRFRSIFVPFRGQTRPTIDVQAILVHKNQLFPSVFKPTVDL